MNINKLKVAQRFKNSQKTYVLQAHVQKEICEKLFQLMQDHHVDFQRKTIFEIGCGTGNLSKIVLKNFDLNHYYLNDLYAEVRENFEENSIFQWCIGDVENIAFPQSLDVIISSSAMQWLTDIGHVLNKCSQALNKHGFLCFSTFGNNNLKEIKESTGQGLTYLDIEDLKSKLIEQGFEVVLLKQELKKLYFAHPKDVLSHLKATGVTATTSNFRWTKQSLNQFYDDYSKYKSDEEDSLGLYGLTYHPIYCIARRVCDV
jgi:malonyl-CoA O-methyltransferase